MRLNSSLKTFASSLVPTSKSASFASLKVSVQVFDCIELIKSLVILVGLICCSLILSIKLLSRLYFLAKELRYCSQSSSHFIFIIIPTITFTFVIISSIFPYFSKSNFLLSKLIICNCSPICKSSAK